MTAGDRLKQLSGLAGVTAAVMLLTIGSGATAGAALVDYSKLPSATAAVHLLTDITVVSGGGSGGGASGGGWSRIYYRESSARRVEQLDLEALPETVKLSEIEAPVISRKDGSAWEAQHYKQVRRQIAKQRTADIQREYRLLGIEKLIAEHEQEQEDIEIVFLMLH